MLRQKKKKKSVCVNEREQRKGERERAKKENVREFKDVSKNILCH
jgi:hypothetical protein